MTAAPRVSVVMAVYNGAPTIDTTIASILGQTHSEIELVIVDDGSNDGTPDKLDRWADVDNRVVVLGDGVNRGRSSARNRALDAASGEWVATCDADDLYSPSRLADLLGVAATHPETALISDDLMSFEVRGNRVVLGHRFASRSTWRAGRVRPVDRRAWALDKRNMTPLVRHQHLLDSGARYPEGVSNAEDAAFFCELLFARTDPQAIWFGWPRYYYRTGESSRPSNTIGNAVVALQQAVEHTGSVELSEYLGSIMVGLAAVADRGDAIRRREGRADLAEQSVRVYVDPVAGRRRELVRRSLRVGSTVSDRHLRADARREIERLLGLSSSVGG